MNKKAGDKTFSHCKTCGDELTGKKRNTGFGNCGTCYRRSRVPTLVKMDDNWDGIKRDWCIDCSIGFSRDNKGARGRCKPCYHKFVGKWGFTNCNSCGEPFPVKQAIATCKLCREVKKREFREMKPMKKLSDNLMIQPTIKEKLRLRPLMEDMKFLLLREKCGTFGDTDYFKTLHLYLEIFDYEMALDAFSVERQVKYMLGRIKHLYDNLILIK